MTQLQRGYGALFANEICQAFKVRHHAVIPQAQIAHRATAPALDLGRFHENQTRANYGEASDIHQMPIGWKALLTGRLMHGRHYHPVFQRDVTKGQGGEQHGSRHGYVSFLQLGREGP